VGTSEAETLVSGKAECLLAIGEDKKSRLFGVTFSFKGDYVVFGRMMQTMSMTCSIF